jgi:hypothetical protein
LLVVALVGVAVSVGCGVAVIQVAPRSPDGIVGSRQSARTAGVFAVTFACGAGSGVGVGGSVCVCDIRWSLNLLLLLMLLLLSPLLRQLLLQVRKLHARAGRDSGREHRSRRRRCGRPAGHSDALPARQQ